MSRAWITIAFMAIVSGIGTLIGLANLPGDWYAGLIKPSFNPPNWIFGPVWAVLYILIGVAGARIWVRAKGSSVMLIWFLQMILNFSWSPTFFGAHNVDAALLIILAMLALIIAFIVKARRLDKLAALYFIPYALWVSFAALLNFSLYLLN